MKSNVRSPKLAHLRTAVWLDYCLSTLKVSEAKFQTDYLGDPGEPGQEVWRWKNKRQNVGPKTASQVADRAIEKLSADLIELISDDSQQQLINQLAPIMHEVNPSSVAITAASPDSRELTRYSTYSLFKLPLWELLDPKALRPCDLLKICRPHLSSLEKDGVWRSPTDFFRFEYQGGLRSMVTGKRVSAITPWSLPNYGTGISSFELLPVRPWLDSDLLAERGDLFGFTGILAAMRLAGIQRDQELLTHHTINAHRGLVALGRLLPFRMYWRRFAYRFLELQRFLGVKDIAPRIGKLEQAINAHSFLPSAKIQTRLYKPRVLLAKSQSAVSSFSMAVSPKKYALVRKTGRAGHLDWRPQLWALEQIDRGTNQS